VIPVIPRITALEAAMIGRREDQWSLFYQFRLDERVPKDHLIDRFVTAALTDIHERLYDLFVIGTYTERAPFLARIHVKHDAFRRATTQQHFIFRAESPVIRSSRWTL
jgi:hypothetical protein